MSKRLLIAVGAVGLWPALALASDMTSLAAPMALLFVVAPLTLVHLSGTLVLAIKGLYRRAVVAWGHVLIASIAPVLGMAAAGSELSATRHAQDLIFALILLLGVLALSWLSMAIHRFRGRWASAYIDTAATPGVNATVWLCLPAMQIKTFGTPAPARQVFA